MAATTINGTDFAVMLRSGAANLKKHEDEVNDLNVFPIPDGDTGSNMLLTLLGGVGDPGDAEKELGQAAKTAADGMLMCARGNSGVILSQFFSGLAEGLGGLEQADRDNLARAFDEGVRKAYGAVLTPVEGTVLTVARESSEFASQADSDSPAGYLGDVAEGARRSLARTPELLSVLKEAGVVDSGGAGFIYIIEGMRSALAGDGSVAQFAEGDADLLAGPGSPKEVDYDLFTADSELDYGYCTEVLVRLQNAKCDVENFDVSVVRDYLQTVGDSIVAFKNGSALKIHVHTMTPDRVLAFCRSYGEFLSVKIENMSLQHSNLDPETAAGAGEVRKKIVTKAKPFGIVCVAPGEGLARCFRDMGADQVILGGQSRNPSTKDFIDAFRMINAERIIVFPNNSNIILAARQAAEMYGEVPVNVIGSCTVGECHAALSMMNPLLGPDEMIKDMEASMSGVITASVSRCVRDTRMGDFDLHAGQFIGFTGKTVVSADNDRLDTATMLLDAVDFGDREVCIIFTGRDAPAEETGEIEAHVARTRPYVETYVVDGGQEVYDYIIVIE
jgi:DAK2 domain fusion protein YloV